MVDDPLHRGIDCSTYVFLVSYYLQHFKSTEVFVIPSTKDIEVFFNMTQANGSGSDGYTSNERINFLIKNYDFVAPEHIKTGDIIIWRIRSEQDN
jgi:hypothetical protein